MLGLDLKLKSHRGQTLGREEVATPAYVSSDMCYYSGMQEEEECHIPEAEPAAEAVGRGSRITRVAKAARPQGDRCRPLRTPELQY